MNNDKFENVEHINEVITILNSGVEFYREAEKKIDDLDIKRLFEQMAVSHERSAARLQPYSVLTQGEREDGSSFAVESRRVYTKVLAMIKDDPEYTFIDQLEEVEDKILESLDKVAKQDLPLACRGDLSEVRAEVVGCHDRMRSIQKRREHV